MQHTHYHTKVPIDKVIVYCALEFSLTRELRDDNIYIILNTPFGNDTLFCIPYEDDEDEDVKLEVIFAEKNDKEYPINYNNTIFAWYSNGEYNFIYFDKKAIVNYSKYIIQNGVRECVTVKKYDLLDNSTKCCCVPMFNSSNNLAGILFHSQNQNDNAKWFFFDAVLQKFSLGGRAGILVENGTLKHRCYISSSDEGNIVHDFHTGENKLLEGVKGKYCRSSSSRTLVVFVDQKNFHIIFFPDTNNNINSEKKDLLC